jgi:iron complex transport system substrate-binding protein
MTYFPQRIVSLQPSATVTLHALGFLDRVVACTKYCADVVPEVADGKRLIVHDSWTAQADQILAAKPELVLASVPYQEKAVIEILKAGIPFLALAPRSLADVYSDISMIAGIVGAPERAEKLVADMQNEIDAVRRLCSADTLVRAGLCSTDIPVCDAAEGRADPPCKPRVYCEEWGKPLIHSQLWVKELVEAAGGEFIGEPGKHTDAESIRTANPDVVIAAWCGAGDRVPLEKIIRERGWQNTSAAQNRRVYCIRDEYLNTPAPTLISGLHSLACAIHPDKFSSESTKPRQISSVEEAMR